MKSVRIAPISNPIQKEFGEREIAPDKSISHRAVIFSLLAEGTSEIDNFLRAEDTLNSLAIVQKLGGKVEERDNKIFITSSGDIEEPDDILDCGNSGTAMRLFAGFLASVDGAFILTGDKYLRKRPMKRVTEPLRKIGALIDGRNNGELAPLFIRGGKIRSFNYSSPIASAQVKSAMILAGLFADDVSVYSEPQLSRDHTERMLRGMGAKIEKMKGGKILIRPLFFPLQPLKIKVPTDPSSGFFFAVAGAIVPNSKVVLKNILLNKTRIEAYRILEKMGAKIQFIERESKYESVGDIVVEYGELQGVEVSENIPWLIDEIPALAIAMSVAKGESIVRNAKELRVKESDRIRAVVENLRNCNIEVEEFEDGFRIVGGSPKSAIINSFGDHRIAMSFAILGLRVGMTIEDIENVRTSFPNFFEILSQWTKVEETE